MNELQLSQQLGYSLWAKDIVFVVSDGYLEGMHAWLAAYHGSLQSSENQKSIRYTSNVFHGQT